MQALLALTPEEAKSALCVLAGYDVRVLSEVLDIMDARREYEASIDKATT